MGSPPRSPASRTSPSGNCWAHARAASTSATGMTRVQPATHAATTVVVARMTSTTTAAHPSSARPEASAAQARASRLPVAVSKGADLEPQAAEIDEALGVLLLVHAVGLERRKVHPIERSRRTAPGHRQRALVELEPDGAAHVLLDLV